MRGFSSVTIVGNLCRDPETKQIGEETFKTSLTVAVNKVYMKEGQKKEDVSYVDCVAWRSGMEHAIARFAHKGDAVVVAGELKQETWESKDGTKRSRMYILVRDFAFVRQAQPRRDEDGSAAIPPDDLPPASDSEIPF